MPKTSDNNSPQQADPAKGAKDLSTAVARVRRLMLLATLTTAFAVAAVIGIIGYRLFGRGGAATIVNGTVFLPKGAHVDSTTVAGNRIVVTLEVGGVSQVRIFDLKTLQQTGQLQFGTER
jgi:hypothetical protein